MEEQKNFKIIDLKDYVKKEDYTFDYGDFWRDTIHFKSLEEAMDQYGIPSDLKFPKYFTDEDKKECIERAYNEADEQSYMCGYIDAFHKEFLRLLNQLEDGPKITKFEYEEDCWDSIKLKVYYTIDFLVNDEIEEDGDIYSNIEEYISSKVDFDEVIRRSKSNLERYTGSCDKTFDDVFKDRFENEVYEIKERYKIEKAEEKKRLKEKREKIKNILFNKQDMFNDLDKKVDLLMEIV